MLGVDVLCPVLSITLDLEYSVFATICIVVIDALPVGLGGFIKPTMRIDCSP